jgi:hypothetical protein
VYRNKTAGASRSVGRSWSPLRFIRRFLAAATAAGITALGVLVLTGAPAVAASSPAAAATAQATAGPAQIYWTNGVPGTIGRANLDGTGAVQNLVEGGSQPHGVAVDATHIYWTNVLNTSTGAGTIGRANLDGTGINQNFITGVSPTGGLAVDGGHLYWGNVDNSRTDAFGIPATIARANLDGTGIDQNFITGADSVSGIALDAAHLYWANRDKFTIGRASLDGTGVNQNFVNIGSRVFPSGVAVDSGHIYWVGADGPLGRANIDGTGVNPFLIDAGSFPSGLAVDAGHLYWTHVNFSSDPNAFDDAIGRASLDGTGVDQNFIFGTFSPEGVAVSPQAAATVPGAPVIGTAAPGTADGAITATARWNPPASNGGSAVTGYRVRALRMSATGTVLAATKSAVQPGSARQLTMTLSAGNYRFTVQASNTAGPGPQSARSNLVAAR